MKGKVDWQLIGVSGLIIAGLASLLYGTIVEKPIFVLIPGAAVTIILTWVFVGGWLFERRVHRAAIWWRKVGEEFDAKNGIHRS